MKTLVRQSVDLDSVLEEILRESDFALLSVDPLSIVELASARATGRDRQQVSPEGAAAELDRVHRCELAFLLREGARRCEHWTAAEARSWQTLLREALAAARADDLDLCALTPLPPALPDDVVRLDAVELARASLRLAEHPLGRLELGRALQRRGLPRSASGVLAAALHGLARIPGVLQSGPWPDLIGGLAQAQEHSGHPSRARLLRRCLPGRVA